MIRVCTPYSIEKNLGKAYNEAAAEIQSEWICFIDQDVMFLLPEQIRMMHEYARLYPDTGLFTCYTNRIHPLADHQLLNGVSHNFSVHYHQLIAKAQSAFVPEVTELQKVISGFLMLFKKSTWEQIKFEESGECLGVDNYFSQAILNAGLKIRRMDGIYVWHSYRMNDIKDKSHLR